MNLSGPRRTLLFVAVIAVVALGVAAVAFGLGNIGDEDDGDQAAVTTTTTFPFTTTTAPPVTGDTTTTTAAAATTTTRPATTTTTRAATTTSSTSTTLSASPSACGTGQASVAFTAKDLVTTAINSSFTPEATVDNKVTQAIEVEEIILDVVYPGNDVRTVRFTTTGTVIAPGTSASFTADRLTTPRKYESVRFTRFTYFTQGQQANCRVTTP
ncbi:MAG TPA: hypothetical protein VM242_06055 [Acidimicrobiales bacterium]|nr:hypothetical protein [Acidimicrobiales bacterium]